RAEECGVPAARVVTTWSAEELLGWTHEGRVPARAARARPARPRGDERPRG
ncbi:histidinol phosphatase, partial [Streptomyces broussonetiae]